MDGEIDRQTDETPQYGQMKRHRDRDRKTGNGTTVNKQVKR
jgi:hypothetical protein